MKIIIDTNLWISFMIGKRLSMLKTLFTNKHITIYVCDDLIREFKDVASRDKIRKYISEDDVLDTLRLMDIFCEYTIIKNVSISPVRDAKDLYLISLAESIHADYIVTGDKDLLILGNHHKTKIITYADFMKIF